MGGWALGPDLGQTEMSEGPCALVDGGSWQPLPHPILCSSLGVHQGRKEQAEGSVSLEYYDAESLP